MLWGDVEPTPLETLPEIAQELGLGTVVLKNEAYRLGQGSFKALGGAYAVMVLFKRLLEEHLGQEIRVTQLLSPTARKFAESVTVCCATDGNHGKSVAAGARLLGCRSVIFIHAGVTAARAEALGADEVVARGDDVADRFRALAPDGVDAVVDGAAQHTLIVAAVRDGGGLAVVRGWDGPVDRGIHLHKVLVTEMATDHARLLRLRDQASAGVLTLRVADVLPAGQAAQAHRRLAEGGVRGRLVLDLTTF